MYTKAELLDLYNMDLEDLLKYNGMNAIALRKGSVLKVPKEADDMWYDL